MKKILFIGQFPEPWHGVTVINDFLFKELSNKYDVTKYDYRFSNSLKAITAGRSFKKLIMFLMHIFNLIKLILRNEYEYIYFTPNIKGETFFRDLLLVQVFRLSKGNVYLHLHGLGIKDNSNRFYSTFYKLMFKSNHVIHVSQKVLYDEFGACSYSAESLRFLNNSIDLTSSKMYHQDNSNNRTLTYMANFRKSKGIEDVLKVYLKLKQKIKCNLVMIGQFTSSDYENYIKKYIKNNSIEDVTFTGFLEGNEKLSTLANSSAFIYPSYDDSFGLVVLEAQVVGLPVCAYDIGSMKEIINPDTGFVSKVSDIVALEIACEKALKQGRAAPDLDFLRNFDLSTYSKRLIYIFQTTAKCNLDF